jgi:mercuric ion transport protein
MPTVELLYFSECPNVPTAREQLRRAFTSVGALPVWTEVDVAADTAPAHARGYGSPTILVDGKDVTGAAPGSGSSCRIYAGSDTPGVPPLVAIVAALHASPPRRSSGHALSLAVLPGALLSALPVVSCPSCWPAYAGVLGSLGVPVLMEASWLFPVTVGALVAALVGLGYRARRRRGHGPLLLGSLAANGILVGKLALELPWVVYAGTTLLIAASVWNSWPRQHAGAWDTPGCAAESTRS